MPPSIYFKILTLTLCSTSLLSLTLNSMLTIWFLMEINNFIFLCLISTSMKNKKMIFLYFFIQISASLLFLIGLLWQFMTFHSNAPSLISSLIIFLSLILKLGAPPLHFWLPVLSTYSKWNTSFLLFTIQKIIPFMILSLNDFPSAFHFPIIIFCMIIPPFMMFNSTNLKNLLVYASVNQTGWMLILIFQCLLTWMFYMALYTLSLYILINSIKIWKMNGSFALMNTTPNKLINMLILINISGLPPFSFFTIKWYSILLLIIQGLNNKIILLIMLFSSVMMLYMYMYNMAITLSLPLESTTKLTTPLRSTLPPIPAKLLILTLIYSILIIMT